MSALSDFLAEEQAKRDWSSRDIAAEAEKAGESVGHDTVARYVRGDHPSSPSDDVLRALGAAFKVPFPKMRELADLPPGPVNLDLPAEATKLTQRQWDAVKEVIRAMADRGTHQGLNIRRRPPQ